MCERKITKKMKITLSEQCWTIINEMHKRNKWKRALNGREWWWLQQQSKKFPNQRKLFFRLNEPLANICKILRSVINHRHPEKQQQHTALTTATATALFDTRHTYVFALTQFITRDLYDSLNCQVEHEHKIPIERFNWFSPKKKIQFQSLFRDCGTHFCVVTIPVFVSYSFLTHTRTHSQHIYNRNTMETIKMWTIFG